MKTHGFMILVKAPGQSGYKPIVPSIDLGYEPWFFLKTTCMDALYALQRREDKYPRDEQSDYIFTFVKG